MKTLRAFTGYKCVLINQVNTLATLLLMMHEPVHLTTPFLLTNTCKMDATGNCNVQYTKIMCVPVACIIVHCISCSSLLDSSGRHELNARNLFSKVVPLIRTEAVQEIREVAITALGMVNPNAFG